MALLRTDAALGRWHLPGYRAAVAGQAGVREVVRNHIAELDLTLGLAGHRSVAELGPDTLRAAG